MSAYIFLPSCTATIDFMTSHYIFKKDGRVEHYMAFLITNKSDIKPNEIVIIYPFTFPVDARRYRTASNYFAPESASKNSFFPDDLVITDVFRNYDNSPFNFNDQRSEDFRYIGFRYSKVYYHGWLKTSPCIEREEIPGDILRDYEGNGFSMFRLKSGLNLEKNFPQWIFMQFEVDCMKKGFINKLFQGIRDDLPYSHSIDLPQCIIKKLKLLIEEKKGSSVDKISEAANNLDITLSKIKIDDSPVTINRLLIYCLFDSVDFRKIVGQYDGDPLKPCELSSSGNSYSRIEFNKLDGTEDNVMVSYTEPFNLWRFIRAGKLIPH